MTERDVTAPHPTEDDFIPEDVLALKLGVDRAFVKKARGVKGTDWIRGDALRVFWTPAAASRLTATLTHLPEPPPAEKDAPQASHGPRLGDTAVHVVVQARYRGLPMRVLYSHPAGEVFNPGHPHIIRVSSSTLFAPGMRVRARFLGNQCWEFDGNPDDPMAGRRLPRRQGQW